MPPRAPLKPLSSLSPSPFFLSALTLLAQIRLLPENHLPVTAAMKAAAAAREAAKEAKHKARLGEWVTGRRVELGGRGRDQGG